MRWLLPLLLGFTLMLGFDATRRAFGQHPPEHQELHDQFYKTWQVPAPGSLTHRQSSCCDQRDCYPTKTKIEHNQWWFMHRETGKWAVIPEGKLEHNQNDPRESPDGQSHVCADFSGRVLCAVLGGGI